MEMNIKGKEVNEVPKSRRASRIRKFIFFAVIIFIIICASCYVFKRGLLSLTTDGYQAVFLTNGQVYFGKLTSERKWLVLNDVYYLQATEPLQQTVGAIEAKSSNQNIQLVKLGNELHGPLDAMYLQNDKILFWENLKDSSKVAEAIKRDKSNQKILDSASQDKF